MLLTHLTYSQNHDTPKYWEIQDVALGKINLIVGKNAVGKTRMMNVLKNFARQICGKITKLLNGKTERSEERRVGKECRYRWSPYA